MKDQLLIDLNQYLDSQKTLLDVWAGSVDGTRALLSSMDLYNNFYLAQADYFTAKVNDQTKLADTAIAAHSAMKVLLQDIITKLQTGDGVLDLLKQVQDGKDVHRVVQELNICSVTVEHTLAKCSGKIKALLEVA